MKKFKKLFLFVSLCFQTITFAQLGFCNGSSGAPIFFENFGSGTNYGPALPAGITNYTYVNSGFPNDGQYTLFYRTNLIPNSQNWLFSLDHTPDNQPDGLNGKCLIVNASTTPGQFYKRTVTGLCSNTTFEFSAWVLNILNASTGGLPINVTFEIWDATDTILLKSGNTGNISNTFTPVWNQFGLVFTMPAGQTSAILKMRNNGVGGNGNDLAIDDIMFRACGEFSSITNVGSLQNSISICGNETITNANLQVTTSGTGTNVYQWQESTNNINYTDIASANSVFYTIPSTPTVTTYYRVKVAKDSANLNNPFCSTLSEIFTVSINPLPNAPFSNGNRTLCNNQTATISVAVNANESANWYDAPTNGNLVQANSLSYSSTAPGTFYAEAYNLTTGCKSSTRTAVTLLPMITVTTSGLTTICSGETTAINLQASDATATINWIASSTNVLGFSNGTGNTIAQTLTNTGNSIASVSYVITPIINGCEGMPEVVTITVNPPDIITLSFPAIATTYCLNATAPSLPTQSSNTIPIQGTWSPSTINTAATGTTIYTFTPQTIGCQNSQPYQISITVVNSQTPNFANLISVCSGATPPVLSSVSPNGISGTWNPSTIDNLVSGSYIFTPNANQCAFNQTINVTVTSLTVSISNVTPTICSGETTAINLQASDTTATINWTASSTNVQGFSNGTGNTIAQTLINTGNTPETVTYIITPEKNSCLGTPQTVVVTVNPTEIITPVFNTIVTTYCLNAIAPSLPTQSSNTIPIQGTWSPSVIDTSTNGTQIYTFTPQTIGCQNSQLLQISITVGNNFMPDFEPTISLCSGTIPPNLNTTSPNGISGTWNPLSINNLVSGSYVFTPDLNQCADNQTITVTILDTALASISYTTNSAFSENQTITIFAIPSGDYLYQLDNGVLQESPIFNTVSSGTHSIRVIDTTGCSPSITKEVIIIDYPTFFTPNGDGFNDYWNLTNLNNLENPIIRIFNRYGKLLKQISPNGIGWDGTFNGNALPADDYWFTIDFTENKVQRTFKSHFCLSR